MNISKAFDSVDRSKLLRKLQDFGILDRYSGQKISLLTACSQQFCLCFSGMVPSFSELINGIEKVKRRATKFILNLGFLTDVPYSSRLKDLDLLSITYWHEFLDLVLLYKIINNQVPVHQQHCLEKREARILTSRLSRLTIIQLNSQYPLLKL